MHAKLLSGCESRSKIGSVEFGNPPLYRRSVSASGQEPLFKTASGSFYAIMKGSSISSKTGNQLLGAGSIVQVRFSCTFPLLNIQLALLAYSNSILAALGFANWEQVGRNAFGSA
jgi:hypothetical protein